MNGDTITALIGIVMALVIVLANGRLRALPRRSLLMMAGAWIVIVAVAAFTFAAFQR